MTKHIDVFSVFSLPVFAFPACCSAACCLAACCSAWLLTIFLTVPVFGQITPDGSIPSKPQPWLAESQGKTALPKRERMLWADSALFKNITDITGSPVIEIEHWVNAPPKDIAGKFVLVEMWATWCPPCRRSLPLLEYFHEKYKDQLVVVSICETDKDALKKMESPIKLADIKAPLAVDTHRRFANALGVYGIPHAVLIEPIEGVVLWEGMPTQIGFELSDEKLGKILSNLNNPAVQKKLPKTPPFEFKACPPDPQKKYRPAPNKTILSATGEKDRL